jgi:DUF971 family protein
MADLSYEDRRPDVIGGDVERRVVQITWQSGHQSEYDFEYLRWQCPCALCQGEGGAPGQLAFTRELTPEQTSLVDMGPVGNYAMGLTWADGHSTGIYTWENLRRLCPCAECRARFGKRDQRRA